MQHRIVLIMASLSALVIPNVYMRQFSLRYGWRSGSQLLFLLIFTLQLCLLFVSYFNMT